MTPSNARLVGLLALLLCLPAVFWVWATPSTTASVAELGSAHNRGSTWTGTGLPQCGGLARPVMGSHCGRGGSACGAGFYCDVHPADAWAVCCPDAPPAAARVREGGGGGTSDEGTADLSRELRAARSELERLRSELAEAWRPRAAQPAPGLGSSSTSVGVGLGPSDAVEQGFAFLNCRQTPFCSELDRGTNASGTVPDVPAGLVEIRAAADAAQSPWARQLLADLAESVDRQHEAAEAWGPWSHEIEPASPRWVRFAGEQQARAATSLSARGISVENVCAGCRCGKGGSPLTPEIGVPWWPVRTAITTEECAALVLQQPPEVCSREFFHRSNGEMGEGCGCIQPVDLDCGLASEREASAEVRVYRLVHANGVAQARAAAPPPAALAALSLADFAPEPDPEPQAYFDVWHGGGFGSMFQFSAFSFNKSLVERRQIHVGFGGDFKWYTKNPGCNGEAVRCFFRPPVRKSQCQERARASCDALDPGPEWRGQHFDSAWWWALLQAYMFRPNLRLRTATQQFLAAAKDPEWADGWPDISIHLRGGDKQTDGQSRQTQTTAGTNDYLAEAARWARHRYSACGSTKRTKVFVATDSREAVTIVQGWAAKHTNVLTVHIQTDSVTQSITEKTASHRMESAGSHVEGDAKYQAALEVMRDVHLMSRATVFIGMIMSQLGRIAVSVGTTNGRMQRAIAMDPDNLESRDRHDHRPKTKFGSEEPWTDQESAGTRPVIWPGCDLKVQRQHTFNDPTIWAPP